MFLCSQISANNFCTAFTLCVCVCVRVRVCVCVRAHACMCACVLACSVNEAMEELQVEVSRLKERLESSLRARRPAHPPPPPAGPPSQPQPTRPFPARAQPSSSTPRIRSVFITLTFIHVLLMCRLLIFLSSFPLFSLQKCLLSPSFIHLSSVDIKLFLQILRFKQAVSFVAMTVINL